jgi:hypothetical protein
LGKEKRLKVPSALVGCQVRRTAFDYQVRLTLVAHDSGDGYRVDAELVIESPFRFRAATGEWHEFEPGTGSRLAPVLDLFMKSVAAVETGEGGALALAFDDGSELFIGIDQRFESWQLSGIGVDGILAGPSEPSSGPGRGGR